MCEERREEEGRKEQDEGMPVLKRKDNTSRVSCECENASYVKEKRREEEEKKEQVS